MQRAVKLQSDEGTRSVQLVAANDNAHLITLLANPIEMDTISSHARAAERWQRVQSEADEVRRAARENKEEAPSAASTCQGGVSLPQAQAEDRRRGGLTPEYFPTGEIWRNETNSTYELARRYVYSGKELDLATGLLDYGARQYDARQGQWLSPDPAFDGLNLYGFVHNNPVNLIDPTGLDAEHSRANPIEVTGATSLGKPIPHGETFFQADHAGEAGLQGAGQFDANSANSPVYHSSAKGLDPTMAKAIGEMGAAARSSAAKMENGNLGAVDTVLQAGLMAGAAMTGKDIRLDGSGSALGVPDGNCASCSGGRFTQGLFIAATLGAVIGGSAYQGYAALRATQSEYALVSSWADVGTTPDLNSGRWVMQGLPTRSNYLLSGLSGPKWLAPYWNFKFQGSRSALGNSVTNAVPRSSLRWPDGLFKGIFGQRKIR